MTSNASAWDHEKSRDLIRLIASNKEINKSIEIFHKGSADFPHYKLIILGGKTADSDNYITELRTLIKKLNIANRVIIKTDPSFDEIKKTLAESKVIIDSQIGTSMNMPVIEAMASGCIALMRRYSGTFMEILKSFKSFKGQSSLL